VLPPLGGGRNRRITDTSATATVKDNTEKRANPTKADVMATKVHEGTDELRS